MHCVMKITEFVFVCLFVSGYIHNLYYHLFILGTAGSLTFYSTQFGTSLFPSLIVEHLIPL